MQLGLIIGNGRASNDIALAQRAEQAGFNSVYVYDFFASNALARLGAIAATTQRIKIGSAIANTFTRSPMVLAQGAMDIDDIADGRLILGMGTGLEKMNVEWYGVPYGKPVTRAREVFALLRDVFGHEGFGLRWQGDSWDLHIPAYHRTPGPRKDIPLWLAAVNRGMIGAAGEIADGMVGHPVHSRKWHREVTLPLLAQAEQRAGRAAGACRVYPQLITCINADRDLAILDAKRQIGFSFSVEHYHSILDLHGLREVGQACRAHLKNYDFEAMAGCIPDELVEEIAIACTPDEVHDRLAQWEDLTDEPLFYAPAVGVEPERLRANLDAILDSFGTSPR